jgi:ferredoxin/flavodoxin---NADP+ reductase
MATQSSGVPARSGHQNLPRATIVRRKDFTDDLFTLWLEPEGQFHFKSGQYITIGVDGIERPYSIASAPYEPLIELFIERVPPERGGTLTPLLHARSVGDRVSMRPRAKGRFTLAANVTHHVMVATVTGVAPYISMVRQCLHDRAADTGRFADHRFFIAHGASHCDEFVYDRELHSLSEEHPHLIQYVSSVSRPSAARNARWNGPVGRINTILEEWLMRWSPPKEDTVVYLCGNPGMIDDAKARLLPRGWSVVQEQYWQQPTHG